MPNFFTLPLINNSDQIEEFSSKDWTYLTGEKCSKCSQHVIYHESISVCKCHRYAHRKCIIQQLKERNKQANFKNFRCSQCQTLIETLYEQEYQFGCNPRPQNIVGLLISLLSFIACVLVIISYQQYFSQINFALMAISLATGILTMLIVAFSMNLFLTKMYILVGIKSTNLGVVVSAFMDLQEEVTQTQLMRQQVNS